MTGHLVTWIVGWAIGLLAGRWLRRRAERRAVLDELGLQLTVLEQDCRRLGYHDRAGGVSASHRIVERVRNAR